MEKQGDKTLLVTRLFDRYLVTRRSVAGSVLACDTIEIIVEDDEMNVKCLLRHFTEEECERILAFSKQVFREDQLF